jgi:hypothetical protein
VAHTAIAPAYCNCACSYSILTYPHSLTSRTHVDANTGVLYVWGSESRKASTTVVWPGSHRPEIYDQVIMADDYAKEKWNLVKLNLLKSPEGVAVHDRAVHEARRMPMPAGSLLLWNSRTTHQGWCGGPRLAVPVSWEPKERRGEDAIRRKLWMCATGSPSSHSATEGRVHSLASKGRLVPFTGSDAVDGSGYALPLKPSLVPFGVRPDAEEEWRVMQDTLWRGKGRERADKCDSEAIRAILRDEVVDAL